MLESPVHYANPAGEERQRETHPAGTPEMRFHPASAESQEFDKGLLLAKGGPEISKLSRFFYAEKNGRGSFGGRVTHPAAPNASVSPTPQVQLAQELFLAMVSGSTGFLLELSKHQARYPLGRLK